MNRLLSVAQELACDPPAEFQFDFARPRAAHPSSRHVCLFAPMHYEQNYAYPLIVWLHSGGDDERQVQRVMPLLSIRNYVAAGPRGVCSTKGSGFGWGEADERLLAAEQRVFDSIELAQDKFHIAPHRIFLAGFEDGGTMAFRIALRQPRRFAGVLSLSGPFPLDRTALACVDEARSLPLFIAQGCDSVQYPVDRTCQELRLFHAAGMSVTLRQYACGDELHQQMLRDMDNWIMELVTGVACSAVADAGDSN